MINAEAQAQVGEVWGARQWLFTTGLQGVPSKQNPLYVGGHVGVLRGSAPLAEVFGLSDQDHPTLTLPIAGATLGYGRIDLGEGWAMQIELEANAPILFTTDSDEDLPLPPSRLSVGFFRDLN